MRISITGWEKTVSVSSDSIGKPNSSLSVSQRHPVLMSKVTRVVTEVLTIIWQYLSGIFCIFNIKCWNSHKSTVSSLLSWIPWKTEAAPFGLKRHYGLSLSLSWYGEGKDLGQLHHLSLSTEYYCALRWQHIVIVASGLMTLMMMMMILMMIWDKCDLGFIYLCIIQIEWADTLECQTGDADWW